MPLNKNNLVVLVDVIGVTWQDHVTNIDVLKCTGQRPLQDIVAERRFESAGHTLRQSGVRPARSAMDRIPLGRSQEKKNVAVNIPR